MKPSPPNPIVRLLPSLTDLAFLLPVIFLFTRMQGASTMLGDGDTGWHIRTGEWILANGRVPVSDFFSFTKAGEPWYAWEWLWDVTFAGLYHHGGLATVVVASILVLCLTFALLFRLISRHTTNPVIAIGLTFLACAGSSMHWLARPHLFSLLFLVIFLTILDRVREGRTRLLILLPLLTALWTNLHGAFFIGLLVLFAYIAGELASAAVTPDREIRKGALHRARLYAITFLACAAATFVNPYGYRLHAHLIEYLSDPFQFHYIVEFLSISFQNPAALYFEIVLALGTMVAFWKITQRRFVDVFLFAGWAHLGLLSARNIPLFLIVATPIVGAGLSEMLERFPRADVAAWLKRTVAGFEGIAGEFGAIDKHWRLYPLSILAIAILAAALHAPVSSKKLKAEYDPEKYPSKALDFIQSSGFAHRIFTDDQWGDYLLYRLYPAQKSFVDGRSDFYGGKFDEKFVDAMNVKYDWEQYLNGYKIDTIMLPATSALAGALKESRHWRVVYDDTIAIIFRPANKLAPEGQLVSTPFGGEKNRDPRITKSGCDPRITAVKQSKGA